MVSTTTGRLVAIDRDLSHRELHDPTARAAMVAWIAQQPLDTPVYRGLLTPEQWDQSVALILQRNPGKTTDQAERFLNEALGFLLATAITGKTLIPSAPADTGWDDGLIPFTRMYRELGWRLLGEGRFFDHEPYLDGTVSERSMADIRADFARTIEIMAQLGLRLDPTMWVHTGRCNCSTGGACGC